MGLYVRDVDLRRLEATLGTCLAPLAFESCDAWRAAVELQARELLQGDHAVFAIPWNGTIDVHATNVAPSAVRTMGHLFARVPEIPADPVLGAIEAQRVQRRLEVWSRVAAYLSAVRGRRSARHATFMGEVLIPAAMRDSENIDFELEAGHTALCVSYERGSESRRVGAGVARAAAKPLLRFLLPALKAGVASLLRYEAHRETFREWIASIPDAVLLVDASGRRTYQNPAMDRLLRDARDTQRLTTAMLRAAAALHRIDAAHVRAASSRDRASRGLDSPEPCTITGATGAAYRITTLHAPATMGERLAMIIVRPTSHGEPGDGASSAALRARWGLTTREADIVRLLARRATNREMAATLRLSPHTVRHHVERVFLKLGVHSRRRVSERLAAPVDPEGRRDPDA